MNPWPFVWAAYAVTLVATGGILIWALVAMRRAESAVEDLRQR
jgi:heme exporter protein CcmD